MKKSNTTEFINKASIVHNYKYDYSNSVYIACDGLLKIICPIHGEFLQSPYNHLNGCGCQKCAVLTRKQNIPKSVEKFIEQSRSIHGKRYDYTKVIYKSAREKVKIVCKKHGIFLQKPNGHLSGDGCIKCGNKTKTKEDFEAESHLIHNKNYEYDDVIYKKLDIKVKIKCKSHGIFEQTPGAHLKGQGCPKCKKSKGERQIESVLKNLNVPYETPKTFPTCINPKTGFHLYYDFFIPTHNSLIEYDGYQHFQPYYRDKFNLDSLHYRQLRDNVKTKWAKSNGVKLLRIKYTQSKNVDELVKSFLS